MIDPISHPLVLPCYNVTTLRHMQKKPFGVCDKTPKGFLKGYEVSSVMLLSKGSNPVLSIRILVRHE